MRIAISLEKKFDDYGKMCEILNSIEFTELVAIQNEHLARYAKEFNKSIQFFKIDWGNVVGATNIKENSWGKPYDADAAIKAASSVCKYAEAYLKIGDGDQTINKIAKNMKEITTNVKLNKEKVEKRYKF